MIFKHTIIQYQTLYFWHSSTSAQIN